MNAKTQISKDGFKKQEKCQIKATYKFTIRFKYDFKNWTFRRKVSLSIEAIASSPPQCVSKSKNVSQTNQFLHSFLSIRASMRVSQTKKTSRFQLLHCFTSLVPLAFQFPESVSESHTRLVKISLLPCYLSHTRILNFFSVLCIFLFVFILNWKWNL